MMTLFDLNIFIREKLILKRNIVCTKPPILFISIDDRRIGTFFKKFKLWMYISNIKWIFGISWLVVGGILFYFK